MTPSDEHIAKILLETRVIAMIGASVKPSRPSFGVGQYLVSAGYRVIPVNPNCAGETLFGETVVAAMSEIQAKVDMVNLFRRSEFVFGHVEDALEVLPNVRTIWMQLGIRNEKARILAASQGLDVVEDACVKVEHGRLIGRRAS